MTEKPSDGYINNGNTFECSTCHANEQTTVDPSSGFMKECFYQNCDNTQLTRKGTICNALNLNRKCLNESISFRDWVRLEAILMTQDNRADNKIASEKDLVKKFAPKYPGALIKYKDICYDLFSKLDFISIASEDIPATAIKYDINNNPTGISKSKLTYIINRNSPMYADLYKQYSFTQDDIDDAVELWSIIAVEECMEYMWVQLVRLKKQKWFDANPEMRFRIDCMLDSISVSQVFGLIYSSINYALRLKEEGRLEKKNISKQIITGAEYRMNKYLDEGKAISNTWNRTKDNTQSILSYSFFTTVLGIGEQGFKCHPSADVIKQAWGIKDSYT